jgi:hypothetical protein
VKRIKFVGLDVHVETIAVAIAEQDGEVRSIGVIPNRCESGSMILGALPKAVKLAANVEVELQADDRILLYTDGITEVFNRRGEMLDISGVQEIVRKSSCLPRKIKQGILNEVAAWRDGAPTDDACLLLVHVRRKTESTQQTSAASLECALRRGLRKSVPAFPCRLERPRQSSTLPVVLRIIPLPFIDPI